MFYFEQFAQIMVVVHPVTTGGASRLQMFGEFFLPVSQGVGGNSHQFADIPDLQKSVSVPAIHSTSLFMHPAKLAYYSNFSLNMFGGFFTNLNGRYFLYEGSDCEVVIAT